MKKTRIVLVFLASASLVLAASPSPIINAMQSELNRSMKNLEIAGSQRPYFISYRICDISKVIVQASLGSLVKSDESHMRNLDVELRVGDYKLDNSNAGNDSWMSTEDYWKYRQIPVDNDTAVIKHRLWLATDYYYKEALEDYSKKARMISLDPDEDKPSDFSREDAANYIGDEVNLAADKALWQERIRNLSAIFKRYPDILISSVALEANGLNTYFVSSEGSAIQDGQLGFAVIISAFTRSEDGMPTSAEQRLVLADGGLDSGFLDETVTRMAKTLTDFRNKPTCEAYAGPVLIKASASSVYLESELAPLFMTQRKLNNSSEGIEKKVGERVLLPSLNIYDDPTISEYEGQALAGYYRYDDQGVPAQRVNLVSQGVLKNMLMSRSPSKEFPNSNGHYRSGKVSAGNLILESSAPLSERALENSLIAECRRLGKPYGLVISSARLDEGEDAQTNMVIVDGMVLTTAEGARPTSKFRPLEAYKLYTDGRKEPVRGIEVLSASPLSTLNRVIALGADSRVWTAKNGLSSFVAPSILLSEMEIRKSNKGYQKLPVIAAPEEM